MANDKVESVIDARIEEKEKERYQIEAKIKAATAPYVERRLELTRDIELLKDIKREAGLLPPKKPMGWAAHKNKDKNATTE